MNWLTRVAELTDPRIAVAEIGTRPDREVFRHMTCDVMIPNPDSTHDRPCGWSGNVVVALFFDTAEAIWFCPEGHENDVRLEAVE